MNLIKSYVKAVLVLVLGVTMSAFVLAAEVNLLDAVSALQQGNSVSLKLSFEQPLSSVPSSFSTAAPSRVILDFPGVKNALGKSTQEFNEGALRSLNAVEVDGRMRVVLNLTKPMQLDQRLEGNLLVLSLVPVTTDISSSASVNHFSTSTPVAQAVSINSINFRRGKDGEGRIVVDLNQTSAPIDIKQEGGRLVVDFVKTAIPDALKKRVDVTDFATPVLNYAVVQKGQNAQMTIAPKGLWEHNAYQSDNQFVIEIKPIVENPNKLVQGSRGGYQGEKLSLNFQNVEVRRLLQVIGEFTGMNIVVSDSVGGSITLILKDVPWDQALDIILQQKGLDMRKNGNVILIAPRDELATKEKLEFETKQQISQLEPLRTESFQLNYVKAGDMKKIFTDEKRSFLTSRGSVVIDERSNILFVQDIASRLDDLRALIAKIDIPVRQVMIEARIVEASDSFSRNLGVRLGTGAVTSSSTQDSITGAITTTYTKSTTNGWINNSSTSGGLGSVNLPASPSSGTAASYTFTMFNKAMTRYLDIELSALEADGRGKIVSSPRVMTTNQSESLVEQGVEIPYQQATSSGATSVSFRKANLSLKVKPQITPDGNIAMSLEVNKDSANTSLSTGSGVAIDTKHIKTEVLVENGGTVVIGGIYTQETSNTVTKVPVFGDIPYLGWLFKSTDLSDKKTELLVFVTPKIVADSLVFH